MSVKIVLHPYVSKLTNNKETVFVNGTTIRDCLADLLKQYPDVDKLLFDENKQISSEWEIYVNGINQYPLNLDAPVHDGDEITIVMVVMDG